MTRTDLLNHLIQKHGLNSYLEIGVQNPDQNFNKIQCEYKISVDPDPNAKATFCKTSDDFFAIEPQRFDLVFIDGLHAAEQVKKDFENALKVLSPNGFIVLHDCNPLKQEHTIVPRPKPTGHWHGDVYKFAVTISTKVTVDIDCGCLVWSPKTNIMYTIFPETKNIEWDYFDKNRKQLLNLISWDEFINLNTHL